MFFWYETTRGRAISAPLIRRWRTRRRAVSVPDISLPFPNFILFFNLWRKNNEAGNFLNAVEREPVETRVLNLTASEASYKPKQRSYRTTNLKKKFWLLIVPAPKCPAPNCPAPKRRRRIGVAETYPTHWILCYNFILCYQIPNSNTQCVFPKSINLYSNLILLSRNIPIWNKNISGKMIEMIFWSEIYQKNYLWK